MAVSTRNRASTGPVVGVARSNGRGDREIEGIIEENRSGLDAICVQVKRWEGTLDDRRFKSSSALFKGSGQERRIDDDGHGFIRRVAQHIGVRETLFLVPVEQYESTLRIMTNLKSDGQSLFLLPLEPFLAGPEWFLNAIADREKQGMEALWPLLDVQETLPFTGQYQYAVLCKFGPRLYRFIDVYSNGSIDRVRAWLSVVNAFAFQVPETGEAAKAWVYAFHPAMAEALVKVIGERESITEVYP